MQTSRWLLHLVSALLGRLPANIPISEKELPAEITLFNDIIVSDGGLTLDTSTKTHHGKVLDELTTKSTSANQKYLQKWQGIWVCMEGNCCHSWQFTARQQC